MMSPLPRPDYFDNPPPRRVGTLALLERGERFALIRRAYWTPISLWGLPGGSAAPNVLPRSALTLALDAKLGVRATPSRLLALDHAPGRTGVYEGVNYVYQARVPGDAEVGVSRDCGYVELRWVTPEEAEQLAVDHELLRIRQVLEAARTDGFKELLWGIPQP